MEKQANLNALKMFTAILQAGSFANASQKTGIPIATLSRQIRQLEQQLNIQLLERRNQGVKPTPQGQQLFEQTHLTLESLEAKYPTPTNAPNHAHRQTPPLHTQRL